MGQPFTVNFKEDLPNCYEAYFASRRKFSRDDDIASLVLLVLFLNIAHSVFVLPPRRRDGVRNWIYPDSRSRSTFVFQRLKFCRLSLFTHTDARMPVMRDGRKYRMGKNTKTPDEQKYRMSEFFEKKYQQTQTSYYFESCSINVPHPSRLINMASSPGHGLCHIHGRLCVFFYLGLLCGETL